MKFPLANQFKTMQRILSEIGVDVEWFYDVVKGYFPPDFTLKDFVDTLARKKRIRPDRMIWLWYELRKFCPDEYLAIVDFFIYQNLIRLKNAVLHPHRRKAKNLMYYRLKQSEYAFLAEDDSV
jgi:hypothetical protein